MRSTRPPSRSSKPKRSAPPRRGASDSRSDLKPKRTTIRRAGRSEPGAFGDAKPRRGMGARRSEAGATGDAKPRRGYSTRRSDTTASRDEKPRRSFGDKPNRGSFGDAKQRRSFGDKPSRGGSFGDKPHGRTTRMSNATAYADANRGRDGRPMRDTGFNRRDRDAKAPKVRAKRGPWQKSAYLPTQEPTAPRVRMDDSNVGPERLQKVIARAGIASRRNAELLILEGAVTVNGKPITELGTKVDARKDKIKVSGKLIFTEIEPMFVALYKPKGVIAAMNDPEGRQHLGLYLRDVRERVIPVGRLDYNSEGLLLLTNDGAMVEKIVKSRHVPKIYMVKIKGHPTEKDLEFLKRGFFTAEGVVRFASFGVEQALKNKSWLKLEVVEGSKLDLREMLNHKGLLVDRIVRTAIGGISIQGMEPGDHRLLKRQDFERLLQFEAKS